MPFEIELLPFIMAQLEISIVGLHRAFVIWKMAVEFARSIVFKEGFKHSDYKSGDKVAVMGIGGLVAGTLGVKALVKTGILAKFLPLLAKFWWIIIAPIVAFFGFLGKNDSSKVSRRRKRRK